jgi:hypothetical protein
MMELMNLYQEASKHQKNFADELSFMRERGEIDESTDVAELISQYADGQYVYYWEQWSVGVACRFDSGDYAEAWETANDLTVADGFETSEDHVNALMGFCAQEFVEIALREQFSEYEIV